MPWTLELLDDLNGRTGSRWGRQRLLSGKVTALDYNLANSKQEDH